jgi:hypothetical protein
MTTDPCSLYHGFKRINERGCNVKVNGSLYDVDNPDEFFVAVWAMFKLPNRLDRAAYLAACAEHGVTPLDDHQTTQYVIGDYDLGTYFATAELRQERGIPNTIHQRRGFVVAEQRDAAAAQAPAAAVPSMSGELWEACTNCGAQPVHMPLHLCRRCWPAA